jgi:membrane protease YdiL (CAAX protease family)
MGFESAPHRPAASAPLQPPSALDRVIALLEVLLCSDYPTQLALAGTLAAFGYRPFGAGGQLAFGYVVWLSLLDTALLLGMILAFLHAHGESPRDVFLGSRPVWGEVVVGLPLAIAAIAIGVGALAAIQRFAPSLHNVARNPLEDLIRTPHKAWLVMIVVVVAGGIREEMQRAFLLRRFERWLGGAGLGVAVTSVLFGAGHRLQGADAALTTAVLGAFWAVVYVRRRSSVAPVVSHSGFNLLRIGQFLITGG